MKNNRTIKFEYGFEGLNGIIKKVYYLDEIPYIHEKCDVWFILKLKYIRQFTGLKDGNGIDIFEGDIMQHEKPFTVPLIVNWLHNECSYGFNDGCTSYQINDPLLKVIGNIYEKMNLDYI